MSENQRFVCKRDSCNGCMACINICPREAITIQDNIDSCNAIIETHKCIDCGLCNRVCPNLKHKELKHPIYWAQGWAKDDIRRSSASGGAASAIMKSFIAAGGYVCSCLFENGEFTFSITNSIEKAKHFAGSKYVKSNPRMVFQEVKQLLKNDERVLFIGLPCQVAAIQNVCDEAKKLYTIDLICHGTPSQKLFKRFINELNLDLNRIKNVKFRDNNDFGLTCDENKVTPRGVKDSYTQAFLHAIDYTYNCYSCRYATLARISDVTVGDAWGELSDVTPEGVSLVLCQTEKGKELIECADLHLCDVNLEKVIAANDQLVHPSIMPPSRKLFFYLLKKGCSFRFSMALARPKESFMKSIKTALIKVHLK